MSAADELAEAQRMIARLERGERLSILVGSGLAAGRIDIAEGYADVIRDDLLTALRQKAARLSADREAAT